MANDYIPRRDAPAAKWMTSFTRQVAEEPARWGVPVAAAAEAAARAADFAAALAASSQQETRTEVAVAVKNDARSAAETACRGVAALVRACPNLPDPELIGLGLPARRHGRGVRCGPPTEAPELWIRADAATNTHVLNFGPPHAEGRARPAGVSCLQVFRVWSDRPVTDGGLDDAEFVAAATRVPLRVPCDRRDYGRTATYVARWQTRRGEVGPWSRPVSARVAA